MAITRVGGTTGSTAGSTTNTFNPTPPTLPTGSNRMIVLRLWTCGPNHQMNTSLSLGGQAASYTYDSGVGGAFEGRIQHFLWNDSAVGSMSGTSWTNNTYASGATHFHWTLDYYEGVDQSGAPTQSSTLVGAGGDDIPSQTTVSGDWLLSMCGDRYDNDGITYDGTGSTRLTVTAYVTDQDGSVTAADLVATGTSTSDSYTAAGGDATRSWIVLGQASSGTTVNASAASFTLTTHAATVSVSGNVNVSAATKSYTLTTNAATVNAGVAVSANTKTYTLTTYDASVAAGGAALTVDASVVNVVRHSVRYEPRTPDTVRNFRGSCLSAIVTARGYRRVWDFETPLMDTTTAASFEADISTGDLFTLTGYLVGGATVTAAVVDIQRTDSPLYSSFTFTAEESP